MRNKEENMQMRHKKLKDMITKQQKLDKEKQKKIKAINEKRKYDIGKNHEKIA